MSLLLLPTSCSLLPDATAGYRRGDNKLKTGDIGGGGDSIALWLAIVAPVLGAGLYQFGFRPLRRRREKKNGQGDHVCVNYSYSGPPLSDLPDVPPPLPVGTHSPRPK